MADAVQVKLKQIFQRCCPRGGDNHVEIGSVENALRKMNLMADGEAKVLRRALREQDENRDRFVSFAQFERAIRSVVERNVAHAGSTTALTIPASSSGTSGATSPESPNASRNNSLRPARLGARSSSNRSSGSGRQRRSGAASPGSGLYNAEADTLELVEQTTARMIFDLLDDGHRGYITQSELNERWSEVISDQPLPAAFGRMSEDDHVTYETFARAFEEPTAPGTPAHAAAHRLGTPARNTARQETVADGTSNGVAASLQTYAQHSPLLITAGVSALQRRIRVLQAQVQSAHDESDHLRREVHQTQQTMARSSELAEKEIAGAEAALERATADLEARHQAALADLRAEHDEAMRQQRRRLEALEDAQAAQTAQAEGRQSVLDELKADKARLVKDVLQLREELEQAQTALQRHEKDEGMLRHMADRNTALQAANADLELHAQAYVRELEQRQREIGALKEQVEELRERLRDSDHHQEGVGDWAGGGETLASELAQTAGSPQRTSTELVSLQKRIAAQDLEIKALQRDKQNLIAQLKTLTGLSTRLADNLETIEMEHAADRQLFTLRAEALEERAKAAEVARDFAANALHSRTQDGTTLRSMHHGGGNKGDSNAVDFADADSFSSDAGVCDQLRALVREAHEARAAQRELETALEMSRAANATQQQELGAEIERLTREAHKAGQREVALQNTLSEARQKLLAEKSAFAAYKEETSALHKAAALDAQRRWDELDAANTHLRRRLAEALPAGSPGADRRPRLRSDGAADIDQAPLRWTSPGRRPSLDAVVDSARARRTSLDAAVAAAGPFIASITTSSADGRALASSRHSNTQADASVSKEQTGRSEHSTRLGAGQQERHWAAARANDTEPDAPPLSPLSAPMATSWPRQLHPATALRLSTVVSPSPSLSDAVHASHRSASGRLTALSNILDRSLERASTPLPEPARAAPPPSALPARLGSRPGTSGGRGDAPRTSTPLSWGEGSPSLLRHVSGAASPALSTAASLQLAPHEKIDLAAAAVGHEKAMDLFHSLNARLDMTLQSQAQQPKAQRQ